MNDKINNSEKCIVIAGHPDSFLNFRKELLVALTKKYEVYVLAPNISDEIKNSLENLKVKSITYSLDRTGINFLKEICTLIELYLFCFKIKPTLVFCYTPKAVIYGSIAAKIAGVKSIISMLTGLGYAFTINTIRAKIIKVVQKILYKQALLFNKAVIFHNKDDCEELCNQKIVDISKCTVVNGSGVNLDKFAITTLPDEPVFIMISRIIKEKGVYEYIEAASLVKNKFPQAIFYLAGNIDHRKNGITHAEIMNWHNQGIINYLGFIPDVREILCKSSVLILPSYREGTPRVVLEAMAMGRPIITTDVPGCRETVMPGQNGLLVPPYSGQAIAEAVFHILSTPGLIQLMGKESRKLVEKKYDVHVVNQQMLKVLNNE